jgi:hypothetical protein
MWAIFYPHESAKWKGTLRNKRKIIIIDLFLTTLLLSFVFHDVEKKKPMTYVKNIWIIPTLLRRSSLC